MIRYVICLFFIIIMPLSLQTQLNTHEPVKTTLPSYAIYELIQNSRAIRETYLLNRYTGETWQLVDSKDGCTWQRILKQKHEDDLIPERWKGPAYQISISGLTAKGSYLLNTITGATWILYEDPKEGIFWGAVPAPK